MQYQYPSTRRSLARSRTQHLNVSALDLDTSSSTESEGKTQERGLPEQFEIYGRPTLSKLLRQEGAKERFRLDALIDAALDPLNELLGEKRWFLCTEKPSSLDALALGYLSLALVPEAEASWMREGVRRYPKLCAFVEHGLEEVFKGVVKVEEAMIPEKIEGSVGLPWRAPAAVTAGQRIGGLVKRVTDELPLGLWRNDRVKGNSNADIQGSAGGEMSGILLPFAAAAATATAAVGAYAYFASSLSWGTTANEGTKLEGMGAAGAMLDVFDFDAGSSSTHANSSSRQA